jgi:hypothetical protein
MDVITVCVSYSKGNEVITKIANCLSIGYDCILNSVYYELETKGIDMCQIVCLVPVVEDNSIWKYMDFEICSNSKVMMRLELPNDKEQLFSWLTFIKNTLSLERWHVTISNVLSVMKTVDLLNTVEVTCSDFSMDDHIDTVVYCSNTLILKESEKYKRNILASPSIDTLLKFTEEFSVGVLGDEMSKEIRNLFGNLNK